MGFKYLGPSHNLQLEEGGKVYNPGDEVPISLNRAFHLSNTTNGGHMFEGLQKALEEATRPQTPETLPHDILQDVAPDQAPPMTATTQDAEAPVKSTKKS